MTRLLAAGAALAMLITSLPAFAHFQEPVPAGWDSWAMRQFSVNGGGCCDAADAWLYRGAWHYNYEDGKITGAALTPDNAPEIYVWSGRFVDRMRDPTDINPHGVSGDLVLSG